MRGSAREPTVAELAAEIRVLKERQLGAEFVLMLMAPALPEPDSFVAALDGLRTTVESSPDAEERRGLTDVLGDIAGVFRRISDAKAHRA